MKTVERFLNRTNLSTSVFLLFAAVTIVFLPACESAPEQTQNQEEEQTKKEEVEKEKDKDQAKEEETEEDQMPVSEEEMSKLEQEVQKNLDDEQKQALSHYGKAKALANKGQNRKAYDHVQKALKLDSNLQRAIELRNRLANILNLDKKAEGRITEQEKRYRAMLEQMRKNIRAKKKEAKSLMSDQKYDKAKKILDNLLIRLKGADWLDNPEFESLSKEIRKLRDRAKVQAKKREQEIQRELHQQAQKKALEEERKRMIRELRWTDRLMEKAIIFFKQQRYQKTIDTTEIILSKYPQYQAAKELQEDARMAYSRKWDKKHLMTKIDRWKVFEEQLMKLNVPDQEKIKFPDETYWRRVNERAKRLGPGRLTPVEDEESGPQEILSLKRKLESKRVSLEFVDATLPEITEFIEENADVQVVIDDSVRDRAEQKKNFVAKKLRLKNALSLVTDRYNLDYKLDENLIFVTSENKTRKETELQIYNVQNLVHRLQNFSSSSKVDLKKSIDGGKNGYTGIYDDATDHKVAQNSSNNPGLDTPYGKGENKTDAEARKKKKNEMPIANIIRNNIAPESWKRPDTSIRKMFNGQLFVNTTPEVHAKIDNFLKDVRDFAGSMVHVEVRFLDLRDEWMEQFGIELRDLGSSSAGAPAGVFNATGTITHPGPGHDMRFTSFFDSENDLQVGNLPSLNNNGGLGLTFQKLGNTDFNIVLRALEKSEKVTVLESASLTLFNTQQANITMANQQAYIQDVDIQVATAAASFDPIIGIIQTGMVIDVRPIISFDRKYVTLEMQPAIATIDRIRSFSFNNLGVQIQLPQVILRKAGSTVRVPDKGAVLMGALQRTQDSKIVEGIPVLKDIPLIGTLFKETINVDAQQQVHILVSVEILDTAEVERDVFGTGSAFQETRATQGERAERLGTGLQQKTND